MFVNLCLVYCYGDTVWVTSWFAVARLTLREQNNMACLQMLFVVWLSATVGIVYQYAFHERSVHRFDGFVHCSSSFM